MSALEFSLASIRVLCWDPLFFAPLTSWQTNQAPGFC